MKLAESLHPYHMLEPLTSSPSQEKIFKILDEAKCEKDLHKAMRCVMTALRGFANPADIHAYVEVWLKLP